MYVWKMYNRRRFLQLSTLSTSFLVIRSKAVANQLTVPAAGAFPIVISTWDFGIAANKEAWKILDKGGRALDAMEAGVRVPEADMNNHTVGRAGYPDRDGIVSLDACIIDEQGNCGSVAALENIAHPISVARRVMEKTPHVMLVGDDARQFAIEQGFTKEKLLTKEAEQAWKEWLQTAKYKPVINIENKSFRPDRLTGNRYNHDTIGMFALDANCNMSGACTTSGMAFKLHGRVGDSLIIGAGLYIDNEVGGATSTGVPAAAGPAPQRKELLSIRRIDGLKTYLSLMELT